MVLPFKLVYFEEPISDCRVFLSESVFGALLLLLLWGFFCLFVFYPVNLCLIGKQTYHTQKKVGNCRTLKSLKSKAVFKRELPGVMKPYCLLFEDPFLPSQKLEDPPGWKRQPGAYGDQVTFSVPHLKELAQGFLGVNHQKGSHKECIMQSRPRFLLVKEKKKKCNHQSPTPVINQSNKPTSFKPYGRTILLIN